MTAIARSSSPQALADGVAGCSRCERLVRWRVRVGEVPPRRHAGEQYWSRGVAGIGDPRARLLVLGLAPGAHGANRTGRPFGGDASGAWLFAALERYGFASDGIPTACWITNVVKCAPPDNRPIAEERDRCAPWLHEEARLVAPSVVVALGAFAWDAALRVWAPALRPRRVFAHAVEVETSGITLLGSYHPSRQNTNTGRLTRGAFDAVFARAAALLAS